ncbi:hypothetical protein [Winogradskyella endarachnes]|uniref:Uncharacterized protein n=1 Tax=Winogradskyella endarachnes TaxID=2681965 RepID=A0A6L6U8B7_9FLAO|nr:hypothetical protein [Winogradskyella endarachnes]MUU78590.1 hypothetical protein [Winogradskyella endarachnes]
MGKVIAFSFSLLILIQSFNIGLEDFSKFSALMEHANYHKEKYGDNFLEFLVQHYGDKQEVHQDEHKEHEDLPFKDAQQICSHINTPFINFTIAFKLKEREHISIPFNFHYEDTFSSFEKPTFFHPPKHA